jgi:hypothetical protein
MIRNTVLGWFMLLLVGSTGANAADNELSTAELYGQGIHAYFAGDMDQAIESLSLAIDQDPKDPKPYFFRGLALAQKSGLDAAQADFARGAELEASRGSRSRDVSAALQRIQGTLRVTIEKQRSEAQKTAAERRRKANQARYERMKRREEEVLVDPNRPAPKLDFPLPDIDVAGSAPDPFSSGLVLSGGQLVQDAASDAKAATDASAAGDANVRDPFATAAPEPAPKEAPKDPFAGDDPFGAMEASAQSSPKEDERSVGDDPFGQGGTPATADAPQGVAAELFDGKVTRTTVAGKAVGSVFGVLGQTLSGQASKDRDPFGEPSAPAAETPKSSTQEPAENPFQ